MIRRTWGIDLREGQYTFRASSRDPTGHWINWNHPGDPPGLLIPTKLQERFLKIRDFVILEMERPE